LELLYESNNGKMVKLYDRPYRLYFVEGLGDVESDTQTNRSPFQDGVNYLDSVLEPRYITIELRINATSESDLTQLRSHLSTVFNPKLSLGKLTYKNGDSVKEILAVSESIPYYPDGATNRGRTFQKVMITLIAPNPYWRSPNETTKPLVAYKGNFKLPMTFPFMLGTSGSKTTLYNDGDVPSPVRIEIHGPTTNPQIFNRTTGQYIRINRTIAQGEVMHINTESGRQRIIVIDEEGNESSAFGYLDHESDLFYLELGENIIEHVADAGNRHAEVIVRWDSMYVGV